MTLFIQILYILHQPNVTMLQSARIQNKDEHMILFKKEEEDIEY